MDDESAVPGAGAAGSRPPDAEFEQLYREHVADARRLATILVGTDRAEELVAESFARVLAQMRAGRGPTSNFRGYLHVTIRNGFRDLVRATSETPISDQPWLLDAEQAPTEELVAELSAGTAVDALATLPPSWQRVLWHLEVEGRKPGEVADLMGMRAGAVSSLSHRAREGLRQAYLDQHVVALPAAVESCGWTRRRLSQYVRSDLSARAEQKVAAHLDGCAECSAAYLQVDRINEKLAAWLFPVVLLGALPASGKIVAWLAGAATLGAPAASGSGGVAHGPAAVSSTGGGAAAGGATAGVGLAVGAAAAALVVVAAAGAMVLVGDDEPGPPRAAPTMPSDPATGTDATGTPQGRLPSTATRRPQRSDPTRPRTPVVRPAVAVVDDDAPPPPVVRKPTLERAAGSTVTPPTSPPPPPPPPPPAGPIVVQAVAPTATPIQACDTYGTVQLPTTTGVTYALTAGDGRSGPWRVDATAQQGYVLGAGSPTSFSGDLGSYAPCPIMFALTASFTGTIPAESLWSITVAPNVTGGANRTITVRFDLVTGATIPSDGVTGAGWICRTSGGASIAGYSFPPGSPGLPITCDFAYSGQAPPPLSLQMWGMDGSGTAVRPAGTVTLLSDGVSVGSIAFN